MSEKDDYQRLASQFVDMWQKNMAAIMNDSEFIRAFLQMMQASSFSAKDTPYYGKTNATQSPASPAPAPDTGNAAIAAIKGRLDSVEERIGTLELSISRFIASFTGEYAQSMEKPAKRRRPGKSSRGGSGKKDD